MCFLSWQDLIVVKHEPTDDSKHVAWTLGQGLLIQEKIGICWGPVKSCPHAIAGILGSLEDVCLMKYCLQNG